MNLIKVKQSLTRCLVLTSCAFFFAYAEYGSIFIDKEKNIDYLNPLLRNDRIQPAVKRGWLFFAYCPEYAPPREKEYLEQLKQGLLTEEEILYPVLPAMNHEWRETMASDLAERMKNWAIITHAEPPVLTEESENKFDLEESPITNNPTTSLHGDDINYEEGYLAAPTKLQTWAENFEPEALLQIQQRPEIAWYRSLPLDYWAVAPIYKALETSEFPWLKNILIVTDSYDYTKAFDVSICLACNMQGDWGPVIILKINPRKFMDEARPDEYVIAKQIISAASSYYCKNHTKLIGY